MRSTLASHVARGSAVVFDFEQALGLSADQVHSITISDKELNKLRNVKSTKTEVKIAWTKGWFLFAKLVRSRVSFDSLTNHVFV